MWSTFTAQFLLNPLKHYCHLVICGCSRIHFLLFPRSVCIKPVFPSRFGQREELAEAPARFSGNGSVSSVLSGSGDHALSLQFQLVVLSLHPVLVPACSPGFWALVSPLPSSVPSAPGRAKAYNRFPSSVGNRCQGPQRMSEAADSAEPQIYCVFSFLSFFQLLFNYSCLNLYYVFSYIYIPMIKFKLGTGRDEQ